MVTKENYFSLENQMEYFGVSQFKSFMSCEAAALAEIKGEYEQEKTPAFLVGSYVDAHFEGTLDIFQAKHPELFTKQGELKSNYKQAENTIARLERDDFFMQYMTGEQQKIMTGELFGVPWKIKIDSYHPGKAIVDLKVMKDFEPVWKDATGRVPFIQAWGYDIQGFAYQAIEGNALPFFIAAATKEKVPNLEIWRVSQQQLNVAGKIVEAYIDRFVDIKKGIIEPRRCGKCDYCKQTKVLKGVQIYEGSENE